MHLGNNSIKGAQGDKLDHFTVIKGAVLQLGNSNIIVTERITTIR